MFWIITFCLTPNLKILRWLSNYVICEPWIRYDVDIYSGVIRMEIISQNKAKKFKIKLRIFLHIFSKKKIKFFIFKYQFLAKKYSFQKPT